MRIGKEVLAGEKDVVLLEARSLGRQDVAEPGGIARTMTSTKAAIRGVPGKFYQFHRLVKAGLVLGTDIPKGA